MKPIFIIFILIFVTYGCLNLRSSYPKVEYFNLTQMEGPIRDLAKIEASLQLKDFEVTEELETDQIVATEATGEVKRYYYYRWIADVPSILKDFFLMRYNQFKLFAGGVVNSNSLVVPDYIMETQVLNMMAYNTDSDAGNKVKMSLRISLVKNNILKTDKISLFNNVYNVEVQRKNELAVSIPTAFSKAVTDLADKILIDIEQAVLKDQVRSAGTIDSTVKDTGR